MTTSTTAARALDAAGDRRLAGHPPGHRSRAGPPRRRPLGRRRHPIDPLSMESAYAIRSCCATSGPGARASPASSAPTSSSGRDRRRAAGRVDRAAAGLPFAFVRKPGYRGHEVDEPPVRGADVAGRRVLFVDDAVASGSSVERFTASLVGQGAEVIGVFVLVDMREVAESVTRRRRAPDGVGRPPTSTLLDIATAQGPPRRQRPPPHRRRAHEPLERRRPALGPARLRRHERGVNAPPAAKAAPLPWRGPMSHVDLHLHLLPGVDDGPPDEAASLVHARAPRPRRRPRGHRHAARRPSRLPARRRDDRRAHASAAGRDRRRGASSCSCTPAARSIRSGRPPSRLTTST